MKMKHKKQKSKNKDIKPKIILDTESFRAWKYPEGYKEDKSDNSYEIKYKGIKFGLEGFKIITDEKSKEMVFAVKFKPEINAIIYYMPNEKDIRGISCMNALGKFKLFNHVDLDLIDLKVALDNIISQRHIIDKE